MRRLPVLAALLVGAAQAAPLQVSATTSIMADFVQAVGGSRVKVTTIVPPGGDTHTFQPSTGVIRALAQSRALFANGAGLEPWLPRLQASAPKVPVKLLTQGLKLHPAEHEPGAGHDDDHGHGDHGALDPHAWWDAGLAAGYVNNAQSFLGALDPAGKAVYAKNAAAYRRALAAADAYARTQFAAVPPARRVLVTNHDSLHYLAERYGLRVVGAVIPGVGTEREPSARELATLAQTMKKTGARVIFTENTVNARLAQTLAREAGAVLAPPLYTDALGPKGSAGDTFLRALRANVDIMVRALKQAR
ncbi:metal ABC transporter solute-binding protein, Zn/Mn family [Deinococcus arcticus]|uniref:Adhesin n=1 Tax=Deinococcus arcticus TaxID=2136176 RepID=A0A2T3W630_9DEIO|nr:zinc ABC transporter substrate-binding protein [Deinococcus arcticus]PTA67345.1 adhesin [Deinococcus arcticus]